MNDTEVEKFVSKYDLTPLEIKQSICEYAFNAHSDLLNPPHKGMFALSRKIEFTIPDKWKDLYLN